MKIISHFASHVNIIMNAAQNRYMVYKALGKVCIRYSVMQGGHSEDTRLCAWVCSSVCQGRVNS
jgi:hypothetical protein